MKRFVSLLVLLVLVSHAAVAQVLDNTADDGTFAADGIRNGRKTGRSDSIQSQHKEIPRGMKV